MCIARNCADASQISSASLNKIIFSENGFYDSWILQFITKIYKLKRRDPPYILLVNIFGMCARAC